MSDDDPEADGTTAKSPEPDGAEQAEPTEPTEPSTES